MIAMRAAAIAKEAEKGGPCSVKSAEQGHAVQRGAPEQCLLNDFAVNEQDGARAQPMLDNASGVSVPFDNMSAPLHAPAPPATHATHATSRVQPQYVYMQPYARRGAAQGRRSRGDREEIARRSRGDRARWHAQRAPLGQRRGRRL